MADPLSLASALTITEQTGEKRSLRLLGRALPYRPLTLSGTMRAEVAWSPGNPEASVQMLGSAEDETTINGYWKERFLSSDVLDGATASAPAMLDGEPLISTAYLVDAMDSIRRQGQLLEVTWDVFIRIGFLSKFVQKWHNRKDCEWEATFTWIAQELVTDAATFAQEVDTGTMARSWASLLAQIETALMMPFAAVSGMMDKVRAGVNALKAGVNTINRVAEAVVDGTMEQIDAARAVVGALQTIKSTALGIGEMFESLPAQMWVESKSLAAQAAGVYGSPTSNDSHSSDILETITGESFALAVGSASVASPSNPTATGVNAAALNSTSTGTQSTVSTPATDLLRTIGIEAGLKAAVGVRNGRKVARAMAQEAVRQQEEVASRLAPDLLGYFVASDDADLRMVSRDYYSTIEEWQRLMLFNHMGSSRLSAGDVVFVPRLHNEGM